MKLNSRLVLPLAAAGVLLVAVLAVALWPEPAPPPSAEDSPPAAPTARAPAPDAPRAPTREAPPPLAEAPPVREEGRQGERAVEVALKPGDTVPSPERQGLPPPENDAIEPEKPQTARWRLEKTERITALLGRDVERLEREQERAQARGDEEEARLLAVQLRRHREHLEKLRQELVQLAEAARREPPEP